MSEQKRIRAKEKQEMQLLSIDAEGLFRFSSFCPSSMALALDEDKNSDVKSLLPQGDDISQPRFSPPEESRW